MADVTLRRTTPLVELITQQALDEDYVVVAQKKASAGARPDSRGRHPWAVVVIVAFGLLISVAAVQTARNADVTSAGREELISRIGDRRADVAALQKRIAQLRKTNADADARYQQLGTRLEALERRRSALAAETGWAAVSGRGLKVVVDDSPSGDVGGLVRDDDLALLTDGLWRAGASAISVNGQRLTALSAFRNSAEVIRINFASLSPPYLVSALGSPSRLRTGLASSKAGSRFVAVAADVGLTVSMQNVSHLQIPAADDSRLTLSYARPIDASKPKSHTEEMP